LTNIQIIPDHDRLEYLVIRNRVIVDRVGFGYANQNPGWREEVLKELRKKETK
jgi:hypothetical protein